MFVKRNPLTRILVSCNLRFDMKPDKKKRNEISAAVVALRKALGGLTQQQLASDVLHCAISSVARWETSDPPRGKILRDLARVAQENALHDLATTFERFYLTESLPKGTRIVWDIPAQRGYLTAELRGADQYKAAHTFMRKLHGESELLNAFSGGDDEK